MDMSELKERMSFALKGAGQQRDRRRLVFEFGDMLQDVEATVADTKLERVREKAQAFLAALLAKAETTGAQFWHESYLLNSVGEAMARAQYVSEPALAFVKSGLYFYGLKFVEREFKNAAVTSVIAHAELLHAFCARDAFKDLLEDARAKMSDERPFCLVHAYVNELRKRCWAERRRSRDACDLSVALVAESDNSRLAVPSAEPGAPEAPPDFGARVAILFRIFATKLTEEQRRIYLARHHVSESVSSSLSDSGSFDVDRLLSLNPQDGDEMDRATWKELADRFGSAEKTVKREYLRALIVLLSETAHATFGEIIPSNFVRKTVETLRAVVHDKELRLKDNSGRGLGKVVSRWETALRFVLNHTPQTAGRWSLEEGAA
jgi:hypothetical protein